MKPKQLILVLFAFGAVLFFLGRWTGPKPVQDDSRKIDSLNARIKAVEYLAAKAKQETELWKQSAKDSYDHAMENQKPKIIYKQRRDENVIRILAGNDSLYNAMLRARYPREYESGPGHSN